MPRRFPVYHDAGSHARGELSDWTLVTALLDARAREVHLFDANPRNATPARVVQVELRPDLLVV